MKPGQIHMIYSNYKRFNKRSLKENENHDVFGTSFHFSLVSTDCWFYVIKCQWSRKLLKKLSSQIICFNFHQKLIKIIFLIHFQNSFCFKKYFRRFSILFQYVFSNLMRVMTIHIYSSIIHKFQLFLFRNRKFDEKQKWR